MSIEPTTTHTRARRHLISRLSQAATLTWAPYNDFFLPSATLIDRAEGELGAILVVDLKGHPSGLTHLQIGMEATEEWPWLSAILRLNVSIRPMDVANWAKRAGGGAYLACVIAEPMTPLPLGNITAQSPSAKILASQVLRLMGRISPPTITSYSELELILMSTEGQITPSLARRLRRSGLPTPGAWRQLGTTLRAALQIQGTSNSLERIALTEGFYDQSSLSRQMKTLYGLRPGRLRGTVGWQWLVWRWFRRAST